MSVTSAKVIKESNGLQETSKVYRKNVVYRSFRTIGTETVKSIKKSVGSKLEPRMQYRTQLNDSENYSPEPSRLVKRIRGKKNKRTTAVDTDTSFSSDTAPTGTPSKQKLIKRKETKKQKNLNFVKNRYQQYSRNITELRNVIKTNQEVKIIKQRLNHLLDR